MCFNPSPERRVPSPNRYMAFARFCFCKNNKRTIIIVTLQPSSTSPTVAGCRLVGCSVVSGLPLHSGTVAGVLQHVCVCLGPVLASHAQSQPAAAPADWRGRGRVPMVGWSYGRVGLERVLGGGGRRGWCEEWVRRG
jgi:hypothetical protein